MSAPVIDMTAVLLARREEEHRRRFGVAPEDTAAPIAFLAARLLDRVRLRMAAERNQQARSQ